MPAGFFAQSTLAARKAPAASVPLCGACGLYKSCKSPKMPVGGEGRKRILIIGEAPGEREDASGKHFMGKSGQILRDNLRSVGIKPDRDCWFTNSIICRPEGVPTEKQIDYCQPNLRRTVKELNPDVIIPLGAGAIRSLISLAWKDKVGSMARWVGWDIPCQKLNAWICPTFDPRFILRSKDQLPQMFFGRHLAQAARHDGKPWPNGPPQWEEQVRRCYDPDEVCQTLRRWIEKGGTFSFDYETNMLKPDSSEAAIISCAVCRNGTRTVAYPFQGEAVALTRELLRSKWPKIGANIKFEERWTRAKLKTSVKNWIWCDLLGAHWYDNRQATKSVKFQSFVWLGVEPYDDHIKGLLKGGSNTPNQITQEISMADLLLYNGLDAVYEYHIALAQMKAGKYRV